MSDRNHPSTTAQHIPVNPIEVLAIPYAKHTLIPCETTVNTIDILTSPIPLKNP